MFSTHWTSHFLAFSVVILSECSVILVSWAYNQSLQQTLAAADAEAEAETSALVVVRTEGQTQVPAASLPALVVPADPGARAEASVETSVISELPVLA